MRHYTTVYRWPLQHLEDADAIKVRYEPRLLALCRRVPGVRHYWWEEGPMYSAHWLKPQLGLCIEWPSPEVYRRVMANKRRI